jgi:SAM-dependent methyltransferase
VPRLLPELARQDHSTRDVQSRTQRSFSAQWDLYRYGNTTWGTTLADRVEVALHELGWTREDLQGKVILDAGCGNATLSRALADLGATVVGIDLSESVFRAQEHCAGPGLHLAQGNLFFPPLKAGVFDAIYSCGVFHHTPDTRRCFDALVPSLKNEAGARYFVWLYAKRSALFNATVEQMMKVTRRMPSRLLVPLCRGLAPFVEAGSRVLTALRVVRYAPRNLHDRAVQLHDLLSPAYVWYHTFEETRGWAADSGFRNIEETTYELPAEKGDGRAEILDRYRGVCRPGFGILCHGPRGEAVSAS